MSQRADHARARASLQEPVAIQGVWLDAHSGRIKVRVEVNGVWLNVIDEPNVDFSHISHIVEPSGILGSKPAPELGYRLTGWRIFGPSRLPSGESTALWSEVDWLWYEDQQRNRTEING